MWEGWVGGWRGEGWGRRRKIWIARCRASGVGKGGVVWLGRIRERDWNDDTIHAPLCIIIIIIYIVVKVVFMMKIDELTSWCRNGGWGRGKGRVGLLNAHFLTPWCSPFRSCRSSVEMLSEKTLIERLLAEMSSNGKEDQFASLRRITWRSRQLLLELCPRMTRLTMTRDAVDACTHFFSDPTACYFSFGEGWFSK